ncbi:Ig-like domain-containing protein [Butyrivibrio sp. WCD2001]|uniref:Ig-like domain-containing protein n=1 Tax=Butyrivibrio sp. WCD2001 TaxID=1280681 RepID=UPI00041B23C9|nr:Ig-like domain-containing protein [Butyrivibrio sp. WCD2001]
MICPKCGNEINENGKFCFMCGYSFENEKETPIKKKFFSKEKLIPLCSTFAAVMVAITTILMNIGTFSGVLSEKEHPTRIAFKQDDERIIIGDSKTLKYELSPDNASLDYIKWDSSDKNIVSVKNGRITAKSPGEAVITASAQNDVVDSINIFVSTAEYGFLEYIKDVSIYPVLVGDDLLIYLNYEFDGINETFNFPDITVDLSLINADDQVVFHDALPIKQTYDDRPYVAIPREKVELGTSQIGRCKFCLSNASGTYKTPYFESALKDDYDNILLPVQKECRDDYVSYTDILLTKDIKISKVEQYSGSTFIYLECDGEDIYKEQYVLDCLERSFERKDYHIYINSAGYEGSVIEQTLFDFKVCEFPSNWQDVKDLTPEEKEELLTAVMDFETKCDDLDEYTGWVNLENKQIRKQREYMTE